MTTSTTAGVLELNDPAETIYDDNGITIEVRCVTARVDGNPPGPDVMTTVTVDTGVLFNGSRSSGHVPDPNNPGDFTDGDGNGRDYFLTVWSSATSAVQIRLVTVIDDNGDGRWALLVIS